jgi:hypothetical protein
VNAVRYGLAGSVWTNDLTQAHRYQFLARYRLTHLDSVIGAVPSHDQCVCQDRQRPAVGELLAVPRPPHALWWRERLWHGS